MEKNGQGMASSWDPPALRVKFGGQISEKMSRLLFPQSAADWAALMEASKKVLFRW